MRNIIVVLAVACAVALGAFAPAFAQEANPIDVLKNPNASRYEKSEACRALQRQGGVDAIPVLQPMLLDAEMSHNARLALEPMPYPEAGAALRDAMAKTSGNLKAGIISSIAVRGDVSAVPDLVPLLKSADAAEVRAAAMALGTLATPEAAQALTDALAAGVPPALLYTFCDAAMDCAAKQAPGQAVATYDMMRALPDAPSAVREAALRGAILARGAGSQDLLAEALRSDDPKLFAIALRSAGELPESEAITATLTAELQGLAPERKVLLLAAIARRGDASAGPSVLAQAQDGPAEVRVAALNALGSLGYAPALELMATLVTADDTELAQAARNGIAYFPGEEGDAALNEMLKSGDATVRRIAVEMAGQGGLPAPADLLISVAKSDADEAVRVAALKGLEDCAGREQMPALLDCLLKATSPAERESAERSLHTFCARQKEMPAELEIVSAAYGDLPNGKSADVTAKVAQLVKSGAAQVEASNGNFGDPAPGTPKRMRIDYVADGTQVSQTVEEGQTMVLAVAAMPAAVVDALVGALDQAKGDAIPAVLRLLGEAGTDQALDAVRVATQSGNASVKSAALTALCEWPNPNALPAVLELMATATDPALKEQAMQGTVRLLKLSSTGASEALAQYALLMEQADTDGKKVVLSGLAQVPHVGALELALSQWADEAVRAEAVQAAIAIAAKLGDAPQEAKDFFNGKDMTGWTSNTAYWSVQEGALVGRSDADIPRTSYVWSNVEAADFYLACDVKLEPNTANSGIQFRSKTINDQGDALGVQADIGQDVWGRLYHQGGRGKIYWNGRAEAAVKPGDWNRVEILAVGPCIWTAINGTLGVSMLETDASEPRSGIIGMQIHQGAPLHVRYKNFTLIHNPKVEIAGKGAEELFNELVPPGQE